MSRKICLNCGEEFDFFHSGRNKSDMPGRRKHCSYQCQYSYNSKRNKERVNWRVHQLKRDYGITVNEYNEMFDKQNGCCAICRRHQIIFKKKLAVDHCHETGKVRGLLCTNCNSILGHSHDSIDRLENSIKYLEKHYES